jgi:hypothetical protein
VAPHVFREPIGIYLIGFRTGLRFGAIFVSPHKFMHSKSGKRNDKPRNAHQIDERSPVGLKRLSTVLEEYGAAAEEGAVDKVSQLAEEIIEIIAHKRKRMSPPSYYDRRIE